MLSLTLSAHISNGLGIRVQKWLRRFTKGFRVVGSLAEPGVSPIRPSADACLSPQQLLTRSKWRIKARGTAAPNPHEGARREAALGQEGEGWPDGPFPSNEGGGSVTEQEPHPLKPAFRFGMQHGGKLGGS